MISISRRDLLASLLVLPAALRDDDEGIPLFNRHSLDGWKAGEHRHSFRVEEGKIVADGPRAHLFYIGPAGRANFKNFDLKAQVLTLSGAYSGIHFHTQFQPEGPVKIGFKVQINNTDTAEGDGGDIRKTGSLSGIRNIYKALVKDNEWFEVRVQVRDKQAQVWLNGTLVADYIEPDPPLVAAAPTLRPGTFALECCGSPSKVIEAAKANDVAIEINNRYRIPSAAFIQRAKSAGVKFSFGTNNTDSNLGRMEYALAMVKQCGLGAGHLRA